MPTTRHPLDGEARLSRLQKEILHYVWAQISYWEKVYKARGEHDLLAQLQYWGVVWYPSLDFVDWYPSRILWTAADRAVVSRALRRLEQRGLVERKNKRTGAPGRTTNVRLTERGRKIAKRLRKK